MLTFTFDPKDHRLSTEYLARRAEQARQRGRKPLCNIGKVLEISDDELAELRAEHKLEQRELKRSDPDHVKVPWQAPRNRVPSSLLLETFVLGVAEKQVKVSEERPARPRYTPKVHVADPFTLLTEGMEPFVDEDATVAAAALRKFGPIKKGSPNPNDRGLREWTPELHDAVILPWLKKRAALAKKAAQARSAAKKERDDGPEASETPEPTTTGKGGRTGVRAST